MKQTKALVKQRRNGHSTNGNGNGNHAPSRIRTFQELASLGGANSDWNLQISSEDAQLWQNIFTLRARSRDLFRSDPLFQKYREELCANVFGAEGIHCRLKITETEPRTVYAPDEKALVREYWTRRRRIFEWAARKGGRTLRRELTRELDRRAQATIDIGDPDIGAITAVANWWKEWQRAEFCDVRGRRPYNLLRMLRLIAATTDGDCFVRLICDPKVNKFGFAIQLIASEWCDHWLNTTLPNGNEVRMGIEYAQERWGSGKPVAYYFIKRQPNDWQWSIPGAASFTSGKLHDRVPADEIIHYARPTTIDSTRPAPWSASVIPITRHLNQYTLYEVISARAACSKMGWFYSDIVSDVFGEMSVPDPTNDLKGTMNMTPGAMGALPWGIKYQDVNPTHPNGNFGQFRKDMARTMCAGLIGANYNIIANDLEGVSWSAGRLGALDERELWKLIQAFDIDVAERPIFETGLRMALTMGAIKLGKKSLPLEKFDKFNKPVFQGRRWQWTDPRNDIAASAMAIANKLTSRTRECAEQGEDFEETALELAEEKMLLESLGMDDSTSEDKGKSPSQTEQETEDTTQQGEKPNGTNEEETAGTAKA